MAGTKVNLADFPLSADSLVRLLREGRDGEEARSPTRQSQIGVTTCSLPSTVSVTSRMEGTRLRLRGKSRTPSRCSSKLTFSMSREGCSMQRSIDRGWQSWDSSNAEARLTRAAVLLEASSDDCFWPKADAPTPGNATKPARARSRPIAAFVPPPILPLGPVMRWLVSWTQAP